MPHKLARVIPSGADPRSSAAPARNKVYAAHPAVYAASSRLSSVPLIHIEKGKVSCLKMSLLTSVAL